jgi:hypothetical protein
MTSLKTVTAAVLLSALTASPVFAQAAIQEPGAFSFYHPDRDVLNGGAPLSSEAATPQSRVPSDAYAAIPGGGVHHWQHHRGRHARH